ncbi:MAG: metallophosphoesterase [Bacteroidales bacterium]|nr:metallophosphoesterase [Bacteroidales bacterium]
MKRIFFVLFVLAALVSCKNESFVIIQIADAQLGFDAAVKGQAPGAEYINDLSYEVGLLQKAVTAVNDKKPDAVVFTGDQVNLPADEEQWNAFNEAVSGIDPAISTLHIPGNHDVFISEGQVDATSFTSRYGTDRFVYENKKVCAVGINSNLIKYDDPREEEQFEWMKSVLDQADEGAVKLIFCHHPFFLKDIEEEDGYFQIQKSKRKKYFDMFLEKGVDAVYAGHLHDSSEGEYMGIPMKTATSAGYQLGEAEPSYRYIVIRDGAVVQDKMLGY